MKKLSEKPSVHETAKVNQSVLGKYTEVGAFCHVAHSTMGDYSYCVSGTQIAYSEVFQYRGQCADLRLDASDGARVAPSLHLSLGAVF
jgi:hypothetical protein